MCVVSNVGDYYREAFPKEFPNRPWQYVWEKEEPAPEVSKQEFDALKKRVDEMMDLLKKAKEIDTKTGQPGCEQDDKLALLRKIAEAVGVDLNEALK